MRVFKPKPFGVRLIKSKMKIKIAPIYHYAMTAILLLTLAAVFFMSLFLYKDVYQTATVTSALIEMRLETVISEPLNLQSWNRIKTYFKKRAETPRVIQKLEKNPFTKP